GRPWHALRTPSTIFSRLNGSATPLRLITRRLAVSVVEKRRPHSGHCRRRRMESPSSLFRESMTRESGWRQKGQNMLRFYRSAGAEPLSDRFSVGREVLRGGQGHDPVRHLLQSITVVPHHLLRAEERVGSEPRRETRLATGREDVVRTGEVVAKADRGGRPEEDGA